MNIDELIKERSGIYLDIGCGLAKQGPEWIGLDIQDLPGVDIVWDWNIKPWPLPDECAIQAIASHVIEHIPPVIVDNGKTRFPFIEFMDEIWRVLKPGGELAIACPHGASTYFMQDPTHCNQVNEFTWAYFEIEHPFYRFYKPKPWAVKFLNWSPVGNIEVVLRKERIKDV